jgi:hypothetical protein
MLWKTNGVARAGAVALIGLALVFARRPVRPNPVMAGTTGDGVATDGMFVADLFVRNHDAVSSPSARVCAELRT